MMKGLLMALIGHATVLGAYAQAPEIPSTWWDRYNSPTNSPDLAGAICADDLGNVYVGGSSPASNGPSFAVIKYSPAGKRFWTAWHSGPEGEAQSVAVDASRNVFAGGYRYLGPYLMDHVVVKFDPRGNELWARKTNGFIKKVLTDSHGNVYAIGLNQLGPSTDWSTMKFSPSGRLLWEIRYGGPLGRTDQPSNAMFDDAGNLVVAGIVDDDNGQSPSNASIAKYDPSGLVLWQRSFTQGPTTHEFVNDFGIDGSGVITMIGGMSQTGDPYATVFPLWLRYGPDGELLSSAVGGAGGFGLSCAVDADGNLFTATRTHLIKYSPQRTAVWQTGFPSEVFGTSVIVKLAPSGEIVVAGDTWGTNTIDFQTYAFRPDGTMRWQNCFDGSYHGLDNLEGMCIDQAGRVTVTGTSFNGYTGNGGTADDIVTLNFGKVGP